MGAQTSQPLTMLVPKANRQAVYKYLFKEGVMVAKKDFNKPKHGDPDLKTADGQEVPNLQVIKLMQSLKSRGFVTERFNWNWYYYCLTNAGIDYLQKFLNLPTDVVPAPLQKSTTLPAAHQLMVAAKARARAMVVVMMDTVVVATGVAKAATRPVPLVATTSLATPVAVVVVAIK